MSEEWELANNIELLTQSAIEKGNLDTCMIYGISGNCGKKCPKFKDKTCEVYLDTLENEYNSDENEIERLHSIIKEVREKVDSFDVFKEFTFPLMKRDVEQQVKSSIDYEWRKSVKKPILEILDKADTNV